MRGRLAPVLQNLEIMRGYDWHLEVTTLLIPGYNDSKQELTALARFLHTHLGPETPWHISRFHPAYQMHSIEPTPLTTLRRAWSIGREAGLQHVYVGNAPELNLEDTFCPTC